MKLSIVCYLDINSSKTVRELQRELSKVSGSVASLASWEPHVTIGDGIEVNDIELGAVKAELASLGREITAFPLSLQGVESRDDRIGGEDEETTPYLIYLGVTVGDDLRALVDRVGYLTMYLRKWYVMPKPYVPHVTLAFRDLNECGFYEGLKYLSDKDISITATIGHFSLVEKLPTVDREIARLNFG